MVGPSAKGGADPAKARVRSRTPTNSPAQEKGSGSDADLFSDLIRLAGSMPFIVWTATPEGAIDYFNDAFVRYTNRASETLLVDGWLAVVHPDDVPAVHRRWGHSLTTGKPYDIDFRILRGDGKYRWHRVQAQAVLNDTGQVVRWWGRAMDVHELRALEKRAESLAAHREAILESLGYAVYTLDREFRFTYLNRHAQKIMHVTAEESIGKVSWEVLPDINTFGGAEVFKQVLRTGQPDRKQVYAAPLKIWLDVSMSPTTSGLTVSLQDITEIKSLADQLNRAQRLEAIGLLTGGISHDFNNLLTVIFGATESLSSEPGLSPTGREMVDLVTQAATRAADLTHQLLAFARKQPLDPEELDLSRLVTDFIPLLKRTLGEGIHIDADLAPGLPAALVDPGQFENALLNLCINARDAMPSGGILALETSVTELDEEYAAAHGDMKPGSYVLVSVSDTGTGVDPENLERIFDPFFTTKPVGRGSGLGLAMVWGFVKQSGGHVAVYSELGHGTTFRLYLPVAPQEPKKEVEDSVKSSPQVGTDSHILLVEDDDLVRILAADQLRSLGFDVTVASSGPEALEALKGIEHLDLLFTDVILPGGMTGRELAAEITAQRPGTPILFASGYTEDILMHDGQLDSDVVLLSKPYSNRQLREMVHQLLVTHGTEAP